MHNSNNALGQVGPHPSSRYNIYGSVSKRVPVGQRSIAPFHA